MNTKARVRRETQQHDINARNVARLQEARLQRRKGSFAAPDAKNSLVSQVGRLRNASRVLGSQSAASECQDLRNEKNSGS